MSEDKLPPECTEDAPATEDSRATEDVRTAKDTPATEDSAQSPSFPRKRESTEDPTRTDEILAEFPILPGSLAEAWQRLHTVAPDLEYRPFDDRLEVVVPTDRLLEICGTIRDDLDYGMLMSITAVDKQKRFDLIYHIYRLDSACPLVLRCRLPHEDEPQAPSLVSLWAGADFQEREIYDLMGIVFTGHPDLRRILLDDDFPGHPLRKDFQIDPDYVLVRHLRVPGYEGTAPGLATTGRSPL